MEDKFGRKMKDLRISVTDKCNFRCTYCMPAEIFGSKYTFLPKKEVLTFEEITRLSNIFIGFGVSKIRLTGGEPLLRQNLEILVAGLAELNGIQDLSLTTNGYLLSKKAKLLKEAGLGRVTVSLDSINDEIFAKMNGVGHGIKMVIAGIEEASRVGLSPIKVNAVVQKNVNDKEILELARYFKGTGHIVRFIEYMDVGTLNKWKLDEVVSAKDIIRIIDQELPLEQIESNYDGEVALRYRYKDGGGEIGIVPSVTEPFCGSCTRMRLSADGHLYTCLFAENGHDLKTPMRTGASDDELATLISNIWGQRVDKYSEERAALPSANGPTNKVEMYHIGG